MVFALGLVGFARTKMLAMEGTNSRNNPIRLGRISALSELMPVALPPGLFRLATRPIATGSVPTWKTIGMVDVAAFAANAAWVAERAVMTFTRRRTKSAARSGS